MRLRLPIYAWILLGAVSIAPSTAEAQSEPQDAVAVPAGDAESASLILPAPSTDAQQRTPPPVERRRRRPSMVGYIENGNVTSQVRFRFDSGWGNNMPDRAEFFYAKCGCYKFVPQPATDANTPGPGPGIPTELNFRQFYVLAERALSARFSFFGELPFRDIKPQGFYPTGLASWDGSSGIGDISLGAKMALVNGEQGGVTAMVRVAMPTGDAGKGLGTNHASVEPSVLFHGSVNDRVALEGQLGYVLPLSGSRGIGWPITANPDNHDFSGSVLTFGIGPSFDAYTSDRLRVSPVIELVGWHVMNGFETCAADCTEGEAGGTNIVNVKIGSRFTVRDRHSIYGGLGWHLTDAVWYEKILRFEYRLGF